MDERTRVVLKSVMIGKMAIAAALPGFNDLGRSVTPTFFALQKQIVFTISPHFPKVSKKSMWEVKKNSEFCPRGIKSCHQFMRLQGA